MDHCNLTAVPALPALPAVPALGLAAPAVALLLTLLLMNKYPTFSSLRTIALRASPINSPNFFCGLPAVAAVPISVLWGLANADLSLSIRLL